MTGGILIVCAANVCRSPLAEFTLRRAFSRIRGLSTVAVESAGLSAHEAQAVCASVESLHDSDRWRGYAAAHRSRPLAEDDVLRASLILTASRGIRSAVVGAVPESRRRVFTLNEAVWLGTGYAFDAGSSHQAPVVEFQRYLDGRRGMRQLPPRPRRLMRLGRARDPLDIRDGHNLGGSAHRETISAVSDAARAIAEFIVGPDRDRSPVGSERTRRR